MQKYLSFILFFFLISSSFMAPFSSVSTSELIEDSWNTKTPMNYPRYHLGVVAVEGKIYAIGGLSDNGVMDINERYDPQTDTWTTLEPIPTPRYSFAIAAYNDEIYCIGGTTTSNGPCSVIEVYDPVTNSWSIKTPLYHKELPTYRWSPIHACVVLDEQIFFTNGQDLFAYDPFTDLLTEKASISPIAYGNNMAVVDEKIIAIYTIFNDADHPARRVKALSYNLETDEWSEETTELAAYSNIIIQKGAATTGLYAPKKVYVIGRTSTATGLQWTTWVYDPIDNTFSIANPLPVAPGHFSLVVVDDLIYAIGASGDVPVNEQYVPIGYCAILPSLLEIPETTVNEQYVPIGGYSAPLIIPPLFTVAFAIALVIIATSLLFFKKRKEKQVVKI
jgi:N-acetylneuraminic acid mutarotase